MFQGRGWRNTDHAMLTDESRTSTLLLSGKADFRAKRSAETKANTWRWRSTHREGFSSSPVHTWPHSFRIYKAKAGRTERRNTESQPLREVSTPLSQHWKKHNAENQDREENVTHQLDWGHTRLSVLRQTAERIHVTQAHFLTRELHYKQHKDVWKIPQIFEK